MKLRTKILLSVNLMFFIILSLSLYFALQFSTEHLRKRLEFNLNRTHSTVCSVIESKKTYSFKDSIENNLLNNSNYYDYLAHSWDSYFEKNLINSYNYFIRIYDKKEGIIWYSNNMLEAGSEYIDISTSHNFSFISDSLSKLRAAPEGIAWSNFEANVTERNSNIIEKNINGNKYRFFIKDLGNYIVTVGQPFSFFYDYHSDLTKYFGIIIITSILSLMLLGYIFLKFPFESIKELVESINRIEIGKELSKLDTDYNYKEINEIASAINHTLDEVYESQQRLSRFSAEVAHELKTPLTILRGELSLALQGDKSTNDLMITIASSLDEATRLTGVVDALLDLARAETGQAKLFLQESNLSDLLKSLTEDCEILAEEKYLFIKSNIEKELKFSFDSPRMHQAILNILDNAIKYTQEKGIITIDLKQEGNFAVIRVADTGIGIADDDIKKIFESFYRTDEVKMKRLNGLGLGLTMVKWIINAHKGSIDVKSKLGEGSIFSIYIPMNK